MGDKTPLELFLAGVRGWEAAVRRRITGEMPANEESLKRIGKGLRRPVYALQCIYILSQLDTFQTLADPMRRRIVEALRHGEQQVNDIVARAGIHQWGVSRHLHILHDAGFVSMRPEGQRRLYSLKPEPFRALDRWLAQYRDLWEKRLDRLEEALEKKRKRSKTPHQEQDT